MAVHKEWLNRGNRPLHDCVTRAELNDAAHPLRISSSGCLTQSENYHIYIPRVDFSPGTLDSYRYCPPNGQYPTQPTYPVQPPGNPVYPQTLHLPQAPPYTDAPPAYSELYRPSFVHPGAATVPTMSAAFPGASLYLPMAQSVAVGPLGSTIPMAYYPVGPIYPPGSTVLVEGGYDAGARFGAGATAGNIPPPPPGCPPNAAQLAVMQGANVLVTQRKGNFFMGGSDGGYTIW
ncbi:DAZ-associated protein 2 [Fukomys damarensis]|uniref:DAZ-associated protein 2 n=1 Tax=Fukomys damarensis TaxID=885580 RepID=A0A091DH07_FUKDA|nr:DAZ-associated protein 2 [Fukomys damarensis]